MNNVDRSACSLYIGTSSGFQRTCEMWNTLLFRISLANQNLTAKGSIQNTWTYTRTYLITYILLLCIVSSIDLQVHVSLHSNVSYNIQSQASNSSIESTATQISVICIRIAELKSGLLVWLWHGLNIRLQNSLPISFHVWITNYHKITKQWRVRLWMNFCSFCLSDSKHRNYRWPYRIVLAFFVRASLISEI